MKRLLYSPGFPPAVGGQQNFMLARCRAAPDDVDVLAAEDGDSTAFDRTLPFDVERFPYPWERPRVGPVRRVLQLKSAYTRAQPAARAAPLRRCRNGDRVPRGRGDVTALGRRRPSVSD